MQFYFIIILIVKYWMTIWEEKKSYHLRNICVAMETKLFPLLK